MAVTIYEKVRPEIRHVSTIRACAVVLIIFFPLSLSLFLRVSTSR